MSHNKLIKYIAVCQHQADGSKVISIAGRNVALRKAGKRSWTALGGPQDGKVLGYASIKDMLRAVTRQYNIHGPEARQTK